MRHPLQLSTGRALPVLLQLPQIFKKSQTLFFYFPSRFSSAHFWCHLAPSFADRQLLRLNKGLCLCVCANSHLQNCDRIRVRSFRFFRVSRHECFKTRLGAACPRPGSMPRYKEVGQKSANLPHLPVLDAVHTRLRTRIDCVCMPGCLHVFALISQVGCPRGGCYFAPEEGLVRDGRKSAMW